MKKTFALILILSMLLALCPLGAFAETYSGTCGTNVTWSFDSETGVLTISGEGAIAGYQTVSNVPWNTYKDSILYVVIEDGVTSVGQYAFTDLSKLTVVIIPESVTKIGSDAFSHCSSLTSIDIPDSVKLIGSSAFYSCTSLTSIEIPDGVTEIGLTTFSNCTSLTSIVLPDSITKIGTGAFSYCTSLKSIYITDIEAWLNIKFDYMTASPLYNGADLYLNNEKVTDVVIPDSITSIGNYAFYNCKSLTSVIIPDSVTSIGEHAFIYCYDLTNITIPDSIATIGTHAFYSCRSLTNIDIPDSVTSIDALTFSYCESLENVKIGNSVTSIGENAFYNCKSLTSITIPDSVSDIDDSAFKRCDNLTTVIYGGSEEDWNNISIGGSNTYLIDAYNNSKCDHIFGDIISGEGTCIERRECTLCGAVGTTHAENHVWNEGTVLFEGSCTKLGITVYKCTICGLDKNVSEYQHKTESEPTCTESQNCTECGTVIKEALGHTEGEWETLEDGSKELRCTVCGELLDSKPAYDTGDVTGDGKVNMFDYMKVKSYYFNLATLTEDQIARADLTGDGKVNMFDYMKLKAIVFAQ